MIELVSIYKKFGDGGVSETIVFDNFNFRLEDGDFVSLVGGNGSGKTTLLNLITGTIEADEGKILFDGKDISGQKEFLRARKIGRVYQDTKNGVACAMTVAENLSLASNKGKKYDLSRGLSKRDLASYREILSSVELGIEDKMDVKMGALSGGQRQALSLIMATMTPIDVLILDEHTSALDPKTADEIMRLTEQIVYSKKITALMVTHNLRDAIKYGNRLCVMKEGRITLDLMGKEKQNACAEIILSEFHGAQ